MRVTRQTRATAAAAATAATGSRQRQVDEGQLTINCCCLTSLLTFYLYQLTVVCDTAILVCYRIGNTPGDTTKVSPILVILTTLLVPAHPGYPGLKGCKMVVVVDAVSTLYHKPSKVN